MTLAILKFLKFQYSLFLVNFCWGPTVSWPTFPRGSMSFKIISGLSSHFCIIFQGGVTVPGWSQSPLSSWVLLPAMSCPHLSSSVQWLSRGRMCPVQRLGEEGLGLPAYSWNPSGAHLLLSPLNRSGAQWFWTKPAGMDAEKPYFSILKISSFLLRSLCHQAPRVETRR